MPNYLIRFSYQSPVIKRMIDHADINTASEAKAMVGSLGGTLLGYWYAFGDFDGVVLIEAPENSVAAAVGMAIRGTGHVTKLETTVLLSMEEAKASLHLAATANHLPPQ